MDALYGYNYIIGISPPTIERDRQMRVVAGEMVSKSYSDRHIMVYSKRHIIVYSKRHIMVYSEWHIMIYREGNMH